MDDTNKIFQEFLSAHVNKRSVNFTPLLDKHPKLRSRLEAKISAYQRVRRALEPDNSQDTHDSLIGKTFGGCRIKRLIRRGGMGAVYLAEQEELNRDVALKILHPSVAGSESIFGRFRRESRNIAKLDHENK